MDCRLLIVWFAFVWLRQSYADGSFSRSTHVDPTKRNTEVFNGVKMEPPQTTSDAVKNSRYFYGKSDLSTTVILTGAYGIIETPNYPQSYPEMSTLTWEIRLPDGYTVQIFFRDFDVMQGDGLVIRTGNSMDDITLSKDIIIPLSVNIPSNEVTIAFTSVQRLFPVRGLFAEYYATSNGNVTALSLTGEELDWKSFTSPNYPNNYVDSENIAWTITAEYSGYIVIEVAFLDLETGYDFLNIYDGDATTNTLMNPLTTLSGTGGKNLEFITTKNIATIMFLTDHSVTTSGFEIRYKPYRLYDECSGNTTIESASGILQNEDWPELNFDVRDCQWLVALDSGKQVDINVDEVTFPTNSGSLTFYDGDSQSDNVLWASTEGSTVDFEDAVNFQSTSNKVLVILDITDDRYYRYSARYQEVDTLTEESCNVDVPLSESVGEIKSLRYPRTSPPDTQCRWTIEFDEAHSVNLHISNIALDQSSDNVMFYRDSADTDLIQGCGYKFSTCSNGNDIVSDTNVMTIVSNVVSSTSQFKFVYTPQSMLINENDEYSGSALSPNYPEYYPSNYYYVYYISVPEGPISFDFVAFDTETCCDFVYVYDGDSTSANRIVALSGRQSGYDSITSGPNLVLEFVTDGSITNTGFRMEYTAESSSSPSSNQASSVPNTAYSYNTYKMATYSHEADTKYFASPGSPGFYPSDADFYWYNTCAGNRFNMLYSFYRIDIDSSDFLGLYTGIGNDAQNLKSVISSNDVSFEETYLSSTTGGLSTVWFHSDDRFSGLGFYFQYECIEMS